jgi:hypothetical protein
VVDDLEWDVKLYFALNAALHDAACAAWGVKRYYDGWRPIGIVRYLAALGQSTRPDLPSYHTGGLPLIPDLIELVTSASVASRRHRGLTPGKIAVRTWPGPPMNPALTHSGVRWIHGESWIPYQRTNFVTPAFPGYLSGHSCFSRSAAEVLTAFTGTPFFPGGLGIHTGFELGVERGPLRPLTLQWATYFDASDEAGISRVWGGIHPPIDNLAGRWVGSQVGQAVWALVHRFFDGSVTDHPIQLTLREAGLNQCEIRINTLRGFYYQLQSTPDLSLPFVSMPGQPIQAMDSSASWIDGTDGSAKFYRVVSSLEP